ncbi:hypothetical protein COCHEDRAFT_1205353 [Bipolaris maydis C5]|uniref:Heterokaryon incompatibility domain-containing protein n=1 Tax=Cochliobolus heterostrophus (strain C5 / ATCC 48332 / race O) TaxID=701091 RepID=M2U5Z2_COCH5|nr:hypothetical protein COCHEDRAFT_1205353 [Bipolaris maydis C5]KAJ6212527.1 heterokaryon incompatibility protein-domain-containing protein [Bipolaris maydis]
MRALPVHALWPPPGLLVQAAIPPALPDAAQSDLFEQQIAQAADDGKAKDVLTAAPTRDRPAPKISMSTEQHTPVFPITMARRIISKLTHVFNKKSDDHDFYTPLPTDPPTIRLLRLLPGRQEDDINAQLQSYSIAKAQNRYITISYTWGHGEVVPNRLIRCNDKSISISENLFTALRTLRQYDHPILLWADALCINQEDILERTQQVGLMGEIYRNSKETMIWLGEPAANEDVGTDLLRRYPVQRQISASTSSRSRKLPLEPIWTGDTDDDELRNVYLLDFKRSSASNMNTKLMGHPRVDDDSTGPDVFGALCLLQDYAEGTSYPLLNALNLEKTFALHEHGVTSDWHGLVLARAHWQRVWIIQETVLSRKATIRYGVLSAPWSMFAKAATNHIKQRHTLCLDLGGTLQGQDILDRFSDFVLRIEDIRLQYLARSHSGTILQLLWRFRPLQATEKRDKVFALLGLTTNWQDLPPLLPDYISDTAATFTSTTVSNIQRAGSLSVLAGDLEAVLNRKRLNGIPSWVMDWSLPCLPVEIERVNSLCIYKASASRIGTVRFHPINQLLDVEAVYVDSVTTVGEISRHTQISDTCAVIKSWNLLTKLLEQSNHTYPSGGTYENAFWRTLIGDVVRTSTDPDTYWEQESYRRAIPEDYDAFRAWSMWSRCISRDTFSRSAAFSKRDLDEGISAIHHALKNATTSRRFFLTSSGYMGLGPKTTTEGDSIYVFKGSNVPFMVRKGLPVSIYDDNWTILVSGSEDGGKDLARHTASHSLDAFQMVGDCFMYGAMDGEVFEQPRADICNLYLS